MFKCCFQENNVVSSGYIFSKNDSRNGQRGGGEMRLINSVPVSVSVWLKTQIFSLHLEQENNEGGDISKIYTLN